MEHWRGIVQVCSCHGTSCRVGASLCYSSTEAQLAVPPRNAILFMGDRAEGTGNPVIEKLSDLENVASILVSKLGWAVNAWVLEAPSFAGPFAVYNGFLPSITSTGEPNAYDPHGFPAASTTTSILANCLQQVKERISHESEMNISRDIKSSRVSSFKTYPKTVVLGFSKGGVVLNQLLTELAHSKSFEKTFVNRSIEDHNLDFQHSSRVNMPGISDTGEKQEKLRMEGCGRHHEMNLLLPSTPEEFLESIEEFHYVDVGLNSPGAYQTNPHVIEGIGRAALSRTTGLHILLHGTPRQWADRNRPWIACEKNKLLALLQDETRKHKENKLHISEKLYFADRSPSLQMHFEIIENIILS
ncbi:hypothetical protein SUGI_0583060 [Cryptomeria japonica]|uniref:uncharacterized protein LOC131070003 n=1 Tax=Cryptomeria japonica TaxID=3369 RepID=UPI0024149101|nr:uncharacterized protein LOC131070003 [Cryptomeria japonica]GLJ29562.1 hypothetical protein SUGI_0583060 [Cryptomeria japonica]